MADAAYGLWPLVILNTVFAASFFHPKTRRDWRAMGAYTAFLVALFTEMYGTWSGDPHLSLFHLASYLGIGGGFWLIAAAWNVLHEAAIGGGLATTGLIMFPILVAVYMRLARTEEREVAWQFGDQWRAYAAITPAFWPRLRGNPPHLRDRRPPAARGEPR